MRRLLAALLTLCIAVPASATRVLIVRQPAKTDASVNNNAVHHQQWVLESVLKTLGVDYDVLPQAAVASRVTGPSGNLNQNAIRTGTVYLTTGSVPLTRSYGAIIHEGFAIGQTTRFPGYNPDTLTISTSWPSVPTVFFGPQRLGSASMFRNAATCSTGIGSSIGAAGNLGYEFSQVQVGFTDAFKASPSNIYYRRDANALVKDGANTPGFTKSRVIAASSDVAYRTNGTTSCTWCDSLGFPSSYFSTTAGSSADTVMIWTRERFLGDRSPLIFALPIHGGNGASDVPFGLYAMTIALLDSACGGGVIGQTPGWQPPKFAVVLSGAFSHSDSDVNSSSEWGAHGVFYPSDTAAVKAGIDSLKALGIPLTVTVNVDSIEAYPNEKDWYFNIPTARFSPESRTLATGTTGIANGVATNGPASGNASNTFFADPFGFKRTRTIISSDRYNYGTGCNGTDTSMSCMIQYMRDRLASYPQISGRLSSAILASSFDYIPFNYSATNLPGRDSVEAAMLRSGYNVALGQVMLIRASPNNRHSFSSLGGTTQADQTGPGQFTAEANSHSFLLNGSPVTFRWLAGRHIDEDPTAVGLVNHNIAAETMVGIWAQPWYPQDMTQYVHQFRTRFQCIYIRPGELGWKQSSTTDTQRSGFYQVKWIVNQIRTINRMAGRTVFNISYPEDIVP